MVSISFYFLDVNAEEPSVMISSDHNYEKFLNLLDERDEQTYDGVTKYDAGIQLLGVSKVDRSEGTYEMDFWFWVTIHEEDDPTDFTIEAPEFDFINAKTIEMESELIEPHYYEVRVKE